MSDSIDLLVFAAHPDDAEIGMGGTILKQTQAGERVAVCDLTLAEMSSNGTVALRQTEAAEASKLLGLTARFNLQLPDRGLRIEAAHIDPLVRIIRETRPRVVAAPYWEDRHPDHILCSRLVQEAVFNAKLRNYLPELPAWLVPQTIFYFINDAYEPDFIIDITDVQQSKMAALQAYKSQFTATRPGDDRVETPLTQSYLERVILRDQLLGARRMIGYAEGFVQKEPLLLQRLGEGNS